MFLLLEKLKSFKKRQLFLNREDLLKIFFNTTALIDVRAPLKFAQGHLPGAINLPILNDSERALIGTVYKKQGRDAAVKLGYNLVSGETKNARLQSWIHFISENPEAIIYCFRGGLRSQIAQKWIFEAGIDRPLIQGGYKRVRNFFIEELQGRSNAISLLVLSGPTGSGKTSLLHHVNSFFQTIDLEYLACHRGSAFGANTTEQPSQINFENALAVSLLRIENAHRQILVEDESRLIGKRAIPRPFFEKIRSSPVIWIEENFEDRINHIFNDYVFEAISGKNTFTAKEIFSRFKASIQSISKKLGGLRTQELSSLIEKAESEFLATKDLNLNKIWIEKILAYYYDPLYLSSLQRRQVKIVFKGSRKECYKYLKELEST